MGYIMFSIAGHDHAAMGPTTEETADIFFKKHSYTTRNKKGVLTKKSVGFPSFEAKYVPELPDNWHLTLTHPFRMDGKLAR